MKLKLLLVLALLTIPPQQDQTKPIIRDKVTPHTIGTITPVSLLFTTIRSGLPVPNVTVETSLYGTTQTNANGSGFVNVNFSGLNYTLKFRVIWPDNCARDYTWLVTNTKTQQLHFNWDDCGGLERKMKR